MGIKLDMLKYFCAVSQHGSLLDAANELGRTPSAVSMMLKQFEEHVGSPLFESARKSRLTPLGKMIYAEAQREVGHFDNTVSVIEGIARSQTGYLRLVVTPSFATEILPRVVSEYTAQHPKIQIDVRDMDSEAIANELLREKADIGIGTLPEFAGMRRQELFSDSFGVVCRKSDPLAHEWHQMNWQNMTHLNLIANGLCDRITDPDFVAILARSRLRVPNTTTLLSLVREGVGITILPRLAVPKTQDDLAFLPLSDPSLRRTVHMVSAQKNLLMPAAREFVSTITTMKYAGTLTKLQNY